MAISDSKKLFTLYLVLLHVVLLLVLLKSDFIERLETYFNITELAESTSFYELTSTYHYSMDDNIPERATLFIGDSHIQGMAVMAVTHNAVNYGIGGETTAGVLERIQNYSSLTRAKAVVLAVGINDLERWDNEQLLTNYEKILSSLPHDLHTVVTAIPTVDERIKSVTVRNERINAINLTLAHLVANYNQVTWLDLTNLLINSNNNLKSEYHVGDGIHLSPTGYSIWIEQFSTILGKD